MSCESTSDELISDLIDAWCSTCLLLTRDESRERWCDSLLWRLRSSESRSGCNIPAESARRLCSSSLRGRPRASRGRVSRLLSLSLSDLPLLSSDRLWSRCRLALALDPSAASPPTPASCRLIWRARSSICRSISSSRLSSSDFSITCI